MVKDVVGLGLVDGPPAEVQQLLEPGPHTTAAARLGARLRSANEATTAANHISALLPASDIANAWADSLRVGIIGHVAVQEGCDGSLTGRHVELAASFVQGRVAVRAT